MNAISEQDNQIVSALKRQGVLQRFDPGRLGSKSKNGGVAALCADGDTDISPFHRRISRRPHEFKWPGLGLRLAPSFPGYDPSFARSFLEALKELMIGKGTRTVWWYLHGPCMMADKHSLCIQRQLALAAEVWSVFAGDSFFDLDRVHLLLHIKRINRAGQPEQNTYLVPRA